MIRKYKKIALLLLAGCLSALPVHSKPCRQQHPRYEQFNRELAPTAAKSHPESAIPYRQDSVEGTTILPAVRASNVPIRRMHGTEKRSPKEVKDASDVVILTMFFILLAGCLTAAVVCFFNPLLAMWIGIGAVGWLLLELLLFGAVASSQSDQIGAGFAWIFSAFFVVGSWFIQLLAWLGRKIFA